MGLSTHVLDTMHGKPASGMTITLLHIQDNQAVLVCQQTLNKDGRTDTPLYADGMLRPGKYRLVFDVAAYFRSQNVALPDPPFLDQVSLDFGVAHPEQHYHVPLLVTPWTYSTYRGS